MKKALLVVMVLISYCFYEVNADIFIDTLENEGNINISIEQLENGYQYVDEKVEVINLDKINDLKIEYKTNDEFYVFGTFLVDSKTYPYLAYYKNSSLIYEKIFNELGAGVGVDFLIDEDEVIILTNIMEKNIYNTVLAKVSNDGKIIMKKEFRGDKDTLGEKILKCDNFYSVLGETYATKLEDNENDTLFSVFQATVFKENFNQCEVNLWGNNTYSRFFDACSVGREVYILIEVCGKGYFESKYGHRFVVLMETDIQFSQPTYISYPVEFINEKKQMISLNKEFCLVTQSSDYSLQFDLYSFGLTKKDSFTYFDYVLKNKIYDFMIFSNENEINIFLETIDKGKNIYRYVVYDGEKNLYEKDYNSINKRDFMFSQNRIINYLENGKLIQECYFQKIEKNIYVNGKKYEPVKINEISGSYGEKVEIYETRFSDFIIRYLEKEKVELKINIKNYGVYDMGVKLEFNAIGYLNGELIESGYEIEKEDKYLLELVGNGGEKEVIYFTVTNLVDNNYEEKVYPNFDVEISKIYSRNESTSSMFENKLKLEKVTVEFDYYYLIVFGIIGVLFGMLVGRKKKCLK